MVSSCRQPAAVVGLGGYVCPRGRLVFGLDDTIERRRGDSIAAKGIYRDPVRSSQGHFVKSSELRSLVVADVAGARILGGSDLGVAFLDGVMYVRVLLSRPGSPASTAAVAHPTDCCGC